MPGEGRKFEQGQSGNPGGRPRLPEEVRQLARGYTVEAIKTAATIMRDNEAPAAARINALNTILDRGWGKPTQPISGDDDGPPLRSVIEVVFRKPGEV